MSDALSVDLDPTRPEFQEYSLTVSEVAQWFFGKTSHWVRWLDREGLLLDHDGAAVGRNPEGKKRKRGEARRYNLLDVQEMAILLSEKGKITDVVRDRALRMVRLQAEIYRMFENTYEFEGSTYPLTVNDVGSMANRSTTWVRAHAEVLGGVKRQWDEDNMQDSWRFPEERMDEKIHNIIHGEDPS